jgi:hypothetical protein
VRYAGFRHEMWLTGLPVDADERNPEHPDDPIADKLLQRGVLAEVFKGFEGGNDLGGAPVATLLEELDRVQKKVRSNIDDAPTDQQKRQKLRGYLFLQAKNIGEREELRGKIDKGTIPEGLQELDKLFDAVKRQHGPADKPNWEGVRHAAAPLLVNLSLEEAWLERARLVLGLKEFVYGVDSSAAVLELIAADVKEGMIRDQGFFVARYQNMIQQLQYEAENLYQANKRLAEQQAVVAERKLEVERRTTERDRNRTELTELTTAANTEVARLEAMQRDLFAVQQRLGTALENTRSLEEQLRRRAAAKP